MNRNNLYWLLGLAASVVLAFGIFPNINPYFQSIFMIACFNISLATSLTVINGFTGQFSLGHGGFMSIGAYTSAGLTYYFLATVTAMGVPTEVAFFLALLAGGILAAVAGYLVGLPSLRLKGDYLAIVTLGFGEIIRVALLNVDKLGGARGLTGIEPLTNEFWAIGLAFITVFSVSRLLNTAPGRAMLSVREDEIAAEAMGVNTTTTKVKAFVFGAFFAGVAGGVYAHFYAYLNPAGFGFMKSFEFIVIIVLGGLGSVSGTVIAAIFLTILPEALRPLQEITKIDFRMIIYSLTLILFMILRPNGLFGHHEIAHYVRKWKRSRP